LPRSFPRAELAAAAGAAPLRWQPVAGGGYAENTADWRVELEDARRVFVKHALDDLAAGWLRKEHHVYAAVSAPFMPELMGWHDGDRPLLVLEDLGDAHWPPPWRDGDVEAALAALETVAATPPPPGLRALEEMRGRLNGWELVTEDPEPLLTTGLCSRDWLDSALPALREAAAGSDLTGGALVHFDVRSDNLCFHDGRVLLVDWNLACVGNPLVDIVGWLPSLRVEGGPEPWTIVSDSGGLAALIAGYFGSRAGLPPPPTAPRVRPFQLAQAEVALPWAARELGLSFPR
jgi:Phosphotransferase enzyme family